ncbi:MAG: hypothetical protein WEB53_07805 [Akkermansiaceae bacterium]
MRQPINHFCSPALLILLIEDRSADSPIERHQLKVQCLRGTLLSLVNLLFDLAQPVGIACGRLG